MDHPKKRDILLQEAEALAAASRKKLVSGLDAQRIDAELERARVALSRWLLTVAGIARR